MHPVSAVGSQGSQAVVLAIIHLSCFGYMSGIGTAWIGITPFQVHQRLSIELRHSPPHVIWGRYIEYERQVDTLRRHRKKMQGDDAEHGSADTAGIRRIHFIHTRALRKFRGDLRLWTKYFAFCRDTNSTRSLDKVSAT